MLRKSSSRPLVLALISAMATLLCTASAHARSVTLDWTHPDPVGQNVVGFKLYQRTTASASWALIDDVALSGLTPSGGVYSYVLEVDETETITFAASAYSSEAESFKSGTQTLEAATPPVEPPPVEPPPVEPPPVEPPTPTEPPDGGTFAHYDFSSGDSGWLDTAGGNSMSPAPGNFSIGSVAGTSALMTSSADSNIHSHIDTDGASGWTDYEYTGRMRKDSSSGGLGITAYSQYPTSDAYYRIRSYTGGVPFTLDPHPDGQFTMACSSTSTGVAPAANTWYRFKVRVETGDSSTKLMASVWREGDAEPSAWQIDCIHSEATRLQSGTVGVWSMGDGQKYWDDVRVQSLSEPVPPPPPEPPPAPTPPAAPVLLE